jgi:hypothetical protein
MRIGRVLKQVAATGLVVAASVILSGCGSPNPEPDPNNSTEVDPNTTPAENAEQSNVQVKVVEEAEFKEVVAGHIGNVVLIDAWATW